MAAIKISSKIDDKAWKGLKRLSADTHRSISGLLTDAVETYLKRYAVRDEVVGQMELSIAENEELGRLLAK